MRSKELVSLSQNQKNVYKLTQTLRIEQRLVLYLREKNIAMPRIVNLLLRNFLEDLGVDVSVPHPKEQVGVDESGDIVLHEHTTVFQEQAAERDKAEKEEHETGKAYVS